MIDHELLSMIIEEHAREGLTISDEELMLWHDCICYAYEKVTGKSAFSPEVLNRRHVQ